MEPSSRVTEIPDAIKPLLERASFVVSTWFCSIIDPFCIGLRKRGQRWVKITYFRNLDLLHTPQARFPIDLVGEITRATIPLLPTHYQSETNSAVLPVENPEVWVLHDPEADAP